MLHPQDSIVHPERSAKERTGRSVPNARIAYPAIERHGVIGDRRTAALVAADGTMNWLCLPDYDGKIVLGALLDYEAGGHWKLGPVATLQGTQEYEGISAILKTRWESRNAHLELQDTMAWPEREDPQDRRHVVLRRLRCRRGSVRCIESIDGAARKATNQGAENGTGKGEADLTWWSSLPAPFTQEGTREFELRKGEEVWSVLAYGIDGSPWNVERARRIWDETREQWEKWAGRLSYFGPRRKRVRLSAMLVHLLSYAPAGSLVAAPTMSLPERIGGNRNYDYRYAWIRDASLSLAILSKLGSTEAARNYMDWLSGLDSTTDSPLQIAYGIRGETNLEQKQLDRLSGYRGSRPVLEGNHAYNQHQIDALGYLNDCAYIYLKEGGEWRAEFWDLIKRTADFTAENWRRADNGIWELGEQRHYVSGKVMSWVALERAVRIAKATGQSGEFIERWEKTMEEIHGEVMERGWSDKTGAFRQHYDTDALDASVLLIPVMEFLPATHPRVRQTVERIYQGLSIDGMIYRFDPEQTPVEEPVLPMGEFEGAFLPCTFWLATTYALAGEPDRAEAILRRCEQVAGSLGAFAEELDPRTDTFLGNTPLLFSQVEYIRAVSELAKAKPVIGGAMKLATFLKSLLRRKRS